MPSPIDIARLKIALDHVKPTVMRRIEVPVSIPLDTPHEAIQAIMPWGNWNAMSDAVHKRHAELVGWLGRRDPSAIDREATEAALAPVAGTVRARAGTPRRKRGRPRS